MVPVKAFALCWFQHRRTCTLLHMHCYCRKNSYDSPSATASPFQLVVDTVEDDAVDVSDSLSIPALSPSDRSQHQSAEALVQPLAEPLESTGAPELSEPLAVVLHTGPAKELSQPLAVFLPTGPAKRRPPFPGLKRGHRMFGRGSHKTWCAMCRQRYRCCCRSAHRCSSEALQPLCIAMLCAICST